MGKDVHTTLNDNRSGFQIGFICAVLFLIVLGLLLGLNLPEDEPEQVQSNPSEKVPAPKLSPKKNKRPEQVRVVVHSGPMGASLFVNGRLIGATPLTLTDVKPGSYSIRLEKDGYDSKNVLIHVADKSVVVKEALRKTAEGKLVVDVEPKGAEVLLDGELAGLTPLILNAVEAGQHDLLIRRTNFEPYAAQVEIQPGKTLTYSDFALRDKILAMLRSQVKTEPQRLAHYIDLAHYLFVNNRIDESVDVYLRAQEMAEQPMTFPPEFGQAERDLERRLRNRDRTRLKKEIVKHKRWHGKFTALFREKLERAEEIYGNKNLDSWAWVDMAARNHIRNAQYEHAERLFLGHLDKVPNSPNSLECTLELLKVRLKMRNVSSAGETFTRLYDMAQDRPTTLLDVGQAIMAHKERIPANDRAELLKMAEKACVRALKLSKLKSTQGNCAYEIGRILIAQGNPDEAVEYFKKSTERAENKDIEEDRMLRMAEAMRLAGKLDKAQNVLKELTQSERAVIRERARAGLILVRMAKP